MLPTNLAFLTIAQRAERQDDAILQRTFVDYGSVVDVLSSKDHQIVFGRRGTGKTHLLTVLRQTRQAKGEVAIQLDMRMLGSVGGIYGDTSLPLPTRATRLLVDVLAAIHAALLEQAIVDENKVNLGQVGPALDEFFDAHHSVRVIGSVTVESSDTEEANRMGQASVSLGAGPGAASLKAGVSVREDTKASTASKRAVTGAEAYHVNFGSVGSALGKIARMLPNGRLCILLDEWSEVPMDLQPYLADLLRRAVMPTPQVTVKIAAIELRTRFRIVAGGGGNIGLEVGADIASAVNLDDYMVFDNNGANATKFFRKLVFAHTTAALEENGHPPLKDEAALLSDGFTQANAFDEAVRACEGVPRDIINILGKAAQRSPAETISVNNVRQAALQWYQGSKDPAVSAHAQAKRLLEWVVDKVIKERQAKAFLLESGARDPLIDHLYDERVLHVLKKGMSSKDAPGARFNVYGIDYGCYVDLINTAKAPQGLLDLGEARADFVAEVPKTDLRSIRRCILDLREFYGQDGGAVGIE